MHQLSSRVAESNLTLEKRTREAQEAQLQAESANRAKSEFLANMSHELRTPLNAVIGFSDAMIEGLCEPLSSKQSEYIDYINKGGKHLQGLIDDILDLSNIEAGKMELDISEFLLKDLVDSSILFFEEKTTCHGLKVTYKIEDGMESMTADAVKVRKVLCNLLSNAIKFTSDGGNVHIAAVLRDNGKFVEFSVEDSGLGISPTEQEKIFQPFTQLDSTYAKKHEGTGLGLSLCRKIVELHGGNIRVRSETGKGSFFYFTIPRLTRA